VDIHPVTIKKRGWFLIAILFPIGSQLIKSWLELKKFQMLL
jgi:hypothetical protein